MLLLFSTLFCLLFPIDYQRKMNSEKQKTVKVYKKSLSRELPTSIPEVDGVIGTLSFPTVRLTETPIYKEETEKAFFHYKYGSFSTTEKGKYPVITVSDHWKNLVDLVKLTQLKIGDCFYLRINDQMSAYQITEILTGDTQEERKIIPNEQILTIERKNLAGFTDDLVIIEGRKIAKTNVQKANITPKIIFSYQAIVIIFLLLNSLFFGGLVISYQRYVRRAHATPFRTKNGGYRKLKQLLQITRGYYILLGLIMSFYLAVLIYRFFY